MKQLVPLFLLLGAISTSAQDYAVKQLEESPRHHEWVQLSSNGRTLHSFVAYPEVSTLAPAVIVIHENRGLNDWARSLTDQLAAAGYIAIAPDLLSECQTGITKTSDFATSDDARKALYELNTDNVTNDLNAVFTYAKGIAAANGNIYVMGFCWGGSQSFRYATINEKLSGAFVFYGTAPADSSAFAQISSPVIGFYGGADARVNATIDQTKEYMSAFQKSYEVNIYEGAGHAFMRSGDDPNGSEPNKSARNEAWKRLKEVIK
jgi:carboxymethylenebutenolidase